MSCSVESRNRTRPMDRALLVMASSLPSEGRREGMGEGEGRSENAQASATAMSLRPSWPLLYKGLERERMVDGDDARRVYSRAGRRACVQC